MAEWGFGAPDYRGYRSWTYLDLGGYESFVSQGQSPLTAGTDKIEIFIGDRNNSVDPAVTPLPFHVTSSTILGYSKGMHKPASLTISITDHAALPDSFTITAKRGGGAVVKVYSITKKASSAATVRAIVALMQKFTDEQYSTYTYGNNVGVPKQGSEPLSHSNYFVHAGFSNDSTIHVHTDSCFPATANAITMETDAASGIAISNGGAFSGAAENHITVNFAPTGFPTTSASTDVEYSAASPPTTREMGWYIVQAINNANSGIVASLAPTIADKSVGKTRFVGGTTYETLSAWTTYDDSLPAASRFSSRPKIYLQTRAYGSTAQSLAGLGHQYDVTVRISSSGTGSHVPIKPPNIASKAYKTLTPQLILGWFTPGTLFDYPAYNGFYANQDSYKQDSAIVGYPPWADLTSFTRKIMNAYNYWVVNKAGSAKKVMAAQDIRALHDLGVSDANHVIQLLDGSNSFSAEYDGITNADYGEGRYLLNSILDTLDSGGPWDTGFGSPYPDIPAKPRPEIIPDRPKKHVLEPLSIGRLTLFPDSGGDIVTIYQGNWPETVYRVQLRANGTTTTFPQGVYTYCKSSVVGDGVSINPSTKRDFLRFVLPVLPPGFYDVLITTPTKPDMPTIVLNRVLRVTRRVRNQAVFALRSGMASRYKVGPRRSNTEKLRLGGTKT